jgi:transposase
MGKLKKWSAEKKFEIALQAVKNETTLNELCKRYEVCASQVHAWKKQLLESGSAVFSRADKSASMSHEHEQEQRVLYEKIGELTVERDFLKKAYSKLHGNPAKR